MRKCIEIRNMEGFVEWYLNYAHTSLGPLYITESTLNGNSTRSTQYSVDTYGDSYKSCLERRDKRTRRLDFTGHDRRSTIDIHSKRTPKISVLDANSRRLFTFLGVMLVRYNEIQ